MEETSYKNLDNHERDIWNTDYEYIQVYLGFSVGYGALWGLPFQMYDNGGIIFAVPYVISVLVIMVPMLTLEAAVGGFHQKGLISQYSAVSKRFWGIPFLGVQAIFFASLNYIAIMTYGVVYFFLSFMNPLPWNSYEDNLGDNNSKQSSAHKFFYHSVLNIRENKEEVGGIVRNFITNSC